MKRLLATLGVGLALARASAAQVPPCVPPASGLVLSNDPGLYLLLRLDETSGTRFDGSPRANDMTPVNGPGSSTDHREGSASLRLVESAQQYLKRASAELAPGFPGNSGGARTALSVGGWVKANSPGEQPLVLKTTDPDQKSWSVWIFDGHIDPNVHDRGTGYSGGAGDFEGTTPIAVGQWYHFVYTFDGPSGLSRLYLNGALEAGPFQENIHSYWAGTAPLRVGYRPGICADCAYADVLLDEVFVMDRVLSADEVASVYQHGIVDPGLLCCTDPAHCPATACPHCDDGNPCNGVERCVDGRCRAGVPVDCDDGDPFTTDTCVPATGACVHVKHPCLTAAECDDANPCTGNACVGGFCASAKLPDGTGCGTATPCEDRDLCRDGRCVRETHLDCDDGSNCTDDACDLARGCVHAFNDAPCDDGIGCTLNDICAEGVCGGTPEHTLCADANLCSADRCDPVADCVSADVGVAFELAPAARMRGGVFAVGGRMTIPSLAGRAVDFRATGLAVQLVSHDGRVLRRFDVPGGSFDPALRAGWAVGAGGQSWLYRGAVRPVDGIKLVKIRVGGPHGDRPGLVTLRLRGRSHGHRIAHADEPLALQVRLGNDPADCGEARLGRRCGRGAGNGGRCR